MTNNRVASNSILPPEFSIAVDYINRPHIIDATNINYEIRCWEILNKILFDPFLNEPDSAYSQAVYSQAASRFEEACQALSNKDFSFFKRYDFFSKLFQQYNKLFPSISNSYYPSPSISYFNSLIGKNNIITLASINLFGLPGFWEINFDDAKEKSLTLLNKNSNHPEANFVMGKLLAQTDKNLATRYFERAKNNGHPGAIGALAELNGNQLNLYYQAASLGDAYSQLKTGNDNYRTLAVLQGCTSTSPTVTFKPPMPTSIPSIASSSISSSSSSSSSLTIQEQIKAAIAPLITKIVLLEESNKVLLAK